MFISKISDTLEKEHSLINSAGVKKITCSGARDK